MIIYSKETKKNYHMSTYGNMNNTCIPKKLGVLNHFFLKKCLPCAKDQTHGKVKKHTLKLLNCRVPRRGTRQMSDICRVLLFAVSFILWHTANNVFAVCLYFAGCCFSCTRQMSSLPCAREWAHGKVRAHGIYTVSGSVTLSDGDNC